MARLLIAFLFATFCSWSASAEEIYTGSGFFITTNVILLPIITSSKMLKRLAYVMFRARHMKL